MPPVIDFHTHVFPPWLRDDRERYLSRDATLGELYTSPRARMATAEDLVEAMNEDGIDVSVVLGIGWTDEGLARETNDYVIEAVDRYPGRLIGFAGINPAWGRRAAAEVDRCARAGLKGIGELHPDTQQFDLGDVRAMASVMEAARDHLLVVTTHSSEPVGHAYQGKGRTSPEVLWRFIQAFGDVTIVCAHWGGGLPFYALMPEVGEALANVYFDTAASPFLYRPAVFEAVAALVGSERILLGSDYPLLRPRRLRDQIRESSLTADQKEAVEGGNAARLVQ